MSITNKSSKKLKQPALKRGGMVVGSFHHEPEGGPKFQLSDTKQVIEEEGFEFNIPEEITNSKKIYTFTGKNVEVIHEILKLAGLSAYDKVTDVKSGDIVICIKSAWDDEIRTYTGTIQQILSAINTSCGCKHIEEGAEVEEHGVDKIASLESIIPSKQIGGTIADEVTPNSNGGYNYSGEAKKIAKVAGLITIPKNLEGTNCGNCIFFRNDFCDHYKVLLPVTSRQCCSLWDDTSLISHLRNIGDAYLFADREGKEFPLNEHGGYDYSGKALDIAREVDLITLPPDVKGTTCAEGNCMYAKDNMCIHPKILLPITDRMSCGWWNNEQVQRPWGEPVENKFYGGGKVSYKQKLKDWQADTPNSPRWIKKKEAIMQLTSTIQKLRNKLRRDLNSEDEREFLTALVISIMDKTGERVGNTKSADKGHFGVTGFERSHVKIVGNKILLDYVGKTGVPHEKDFSDEGIANALKKAIKNSPKEINGERNDYIFVTTKGIQTSAKQVNNYLEKFGITSKNLRGYYANKNVVKLLQRENKKEQPENEKQRKKIFNRVLKQTAVLVGHNAPTLRKHYMLPELPIEYIQKGNIINLKEYGVYKEGGELGDTDSEKNFENKNEVPEIVNEETENLQIRAGELDGGMDEFFKSQPIKVIEWKDVVPTQDFLRSDKTNSLKKVSDIYSIPLPWFIECQGKYYINDGHHRTLEMHERNLPIKAHVYEIKSETSSKKSGGEVTENKSMIILNRFGNYTSPSGKRYILNQGTELKFKKNFGKEGLYEVILYGEPKQVIIPNDKTTTIKNKK